MKIYALFIALFCLLISNDLTSQNLIPNGSFELVKKEIDDHINGTRKGFDSKVHAWYSPTNVSPDIYLPHPNNASFPEQFRLPNAKDGKHYIGLIVDDMYGVCKNYREYVQVKLKDTLEIGTPYVLEFWLSSASTHEFSVGVFLSKDRLVNDKCSMLLNTAQLSFKDSLVRHEWTKLSFEITPSQAYTHITIGNLAQSEKPRRKYCYFDDFQLREKESIIAEVLNDSIIIKENSSTSDLAIPAIPSPAIETVFNANNIQFMHGEFELTATSLLELDQLISYLKIHHSTKIMIEGHTDNSGNDLVNQKLSTNRVKSVLAYITKEGIRPDRIRYKSHGATQPIASNDTEEGRRLNRRVTFLVEE